MLLAHVARARRRLDRSDLVSLGVDEMSSRQGHHYLTVLANLVARRVVFATEGQDHATFERFCEDLLAHNGHPKAITQAAIDLSAADQKGLRENFGNAQVVFDPFHVGAWVGVAVDEVRRWEARAGTPLFVPQKSGEPEPEPGAGVVRTGSEAAGDGVADLARLELRDIDQNAGNAERVRYRVENWVNWARAKCKRWPEALAPLAKAVASVQRHLEGILNHWIGELSTAYMAGLNSVFSAGKRQARGFRSVEYMTTMLYFVAGKLPLPSYPSH